MTETLELLKRLQFYSECDEIRVTWEGNLLVFRFEWHNPEWGCMVDFTEGRLGIMQTKNVDVETYIMDIINHLKRKRENGEMP